jgi:hypothetical protein
MRGIVLVGAIALLCSACQKAEEPAATVELPAASAPAASTPAADAASSIGLEFAQAVARFDPTQNHIIWATPPGVHPEGPWTLDLTVKHKGEVKHEEKIALKAESVAAGTVADIPAGYDAVRLSDGGTFRPRMAEVQKIIEGIIAQYGRGDGELVMTTEIHTALDDAGLKSYCTDKKTPDIRAYLEETAPPKLTAIDLKPMGGFMQKEVEENCPK